MKRFGVTGFAILYALLVLGISVNRTAAWAESKASSRSKSDQSLAFNIGKPGNYSQQHGHKRFPQNSFVVESPLIAAKMLLKSNEKVITPSNVFVPGHTASEIPSRAPPSLG